MRVHDILERKGRHVTTVAPETSVLEVAGILRRQGIGAVVVAAPDGRIAGILSERDLVHALGDDGAALSGRTARELMTERVTTCSPRDDVNDVLRTMTEGRFRHVPVVEDGALSAIVSIGDIVKARIEDLEHEKNALHSYVLGG
ncbi:CBS domain-containing protein [Limimonas halophila]|uniref:CBS domain-containing protein n=1 Tax=Limimonas halophila TaxID=1082479 RepID=A0A1G7MGF7_9PROT|nr:CBS domain-containing protein [Limimonas halophila]SDF60714.1 CBS domain-containing protein [Limimonas halophila]